jgi:type II secretory pathway pseudopilin PulG
MQARASSGVTRRRGEGGFGLIEAVVSVGLVSTVVLALAAGLLTSVKSSQAAKETQEVDAALSSFAESLKGMPYPTHAGPCPTLAEFQATWDTWDQHWQSDGVAPVLTGVRHWDGDSYETTCPDPNPWVHQLDIQVTVNGNTASGYVVVAKT